MRGKTMNVRVEQFETQQLLGEEVYDGVASQSLKHGLDLPKFLAQPQVRSEALRAYIIALHVLVLLLPPWCFWLSSTFQAQAIHYTPISSDIANFEKYRVQQHASRHNNSSIYTGSPTTESNNAWDTLIQPLYFNASADELAKTVPSVLQTDAVKVLGGGYLASFEVYHQLHCLKQLRRWIYDEDFRTVLAPAESDFLQDHLGHCIERLRAFLTCNASLQVNFFTWRDEGLPSAKLTKPFESVLQSQKCVNWNLVNAWAQGRSIAIAPKLLRPSNANSRRRKI